MCTSPPPFVFFAIATADLHALVIEAGAFGEAFDYKMGLAFNTLYCEEEPALISS
jgi:hypothetical protein